MKLSTDSQHLTTISRAQTRVAGVLYLLLAVIGPFSLMYVPSSLYMAGDAAATAQKITTSMGLFRAGIVGDMLIVMIEVALSVLLYKLLAPVNKTLSLIATSARLGMTVVQAINVLNKLFVVLLLSGDVYLKAFDASQTQALAMLFLNANKEAVLIWEVFFGLHLIVLGYLVYKSGYFPAVLGILLVVAALSYLADGFGNLLLPQYAGVYTVFVSIAAPIGELAFTLWLLIKGVNAERWNKQFIKAIP